MAQIYHSFTDRQMQAQLLEPVSVQEYSIFGAFSVVRVLLTRNVVIDRQAPEVLTAILY
jgi:hypothetical protein